MTIFNKKNLLIFFLPIVVLASFYSGILIGKNQSKNIPSLSTTSPTNVDLSLFWEAWKVLEEKFVNKEKIDQQKMIYGATSGMVKSLEDPYTVFFDPEETKKFKDDVRGSFEGIGAEIGIKKGQLLIVAPLEGSPAQKVGLKAGDKILKISETFTADLSVEEAVNLIRGPKGTEVTLTVLRESWKNPKEIKIKRELISIPSIKWEIVNDDIAYIKIYQFFEGAANDFKKRAIEVLKSPAKKIILDLRDNPGGYLEVANEIGGWFLKKGEVITIEDFGQGKQKFYNTQGNAKFLEYPLVVLINKGSASGSEILAGALRDNRQALLIGEKSFGKGSVQELSELKNKSSLKVTVAKWLTPKGQSINDKGLEPDIKIELTEKDFEEGKDPQLDKAIEVIKGMR